MLSQLDLEVSYCSISPVGLRITGRFTGEEAIESLRFELPRLPSLCPLELLLYPAPTVLFFLELVPYYG